MTLQRFVAFYLLTVLVFLTENDRIIRGGQVFAAAAAVGDGVHARPMDDPSRHQDEQPLVPTPANICEIQTGGGRRVLRRAARVTARNGWI